MDSQQTVMTTLDNYCLKKNIKHIDFIKIDTEGHDYNILLGMNKTIKKYKPVFLIEYNLTIFNKICKYLKYYKPYIYDFKTDKFLKISNRNRSQISRTSKQNLLTNRNVFFIPNTRKFEN